VADFERIEPGTAAWAAYFGNHIARYRFAGERLRQKLDGLPVLDAACGVGYGAEYLAATLARPVTGIDRDAHALAIASRRFAHDGVTFRADDCSTLAAAAADGPFAAVVSFETIEHLPDPAAFLQACRRRLAPRGLIVCSTPNALVTSPGGDIAWAFHEREYRSGELAALLRAAGFGDLELYGQQWTTMGRLRNELRGELNTIRSNPFFRLGASIQRRLRGRDIGPPLPEQPDDFEFVRYESAGAIDALGTDGPFVLVAVAAAAAT
jgi:2-polyprenyl-3-methyl-5-hydroxy-6-metoxy-1,4-benzoquinol methylase